jgi:FAD:protein FMN transferase
MLTRRDILMAGIALLAARPAEAQPLASITRTSRALGAEVRITLFHASGDEAARAADAALAEVSRIDRLLSLYDPDSQVSILNRRGALDEPHPDLLHVLRACRSLSEKTAGAFDITVQPLWELYAKAKEAGRLPTDVELAAAKAKVGYQRIGIERDRVRLEPGTAITLNAIAQGYAADCAAAILRRNGVRHAMVDTGEIAAIGPKADGSPWSIGVQHPRRPDAYIAIVKLADRCMSTSGDYATRFTEDKAYHHIFNPATGRSPADLASSTVVAASAMEADSLSTACLVLGMEKALGLIGGLRDAEAMFIHKDGQLAATPGFPA